MVIKLNDVAFADLTRQESNIAKIEMRARADGLAAPDQLRRLKIAGDACLQIAYQYYALERDRSLVATYGHRAASWLAAWLEMSESRKDPVAPWVFIEALGQGCAFADMETFRRLGALEGYPGDDVLELYANSMLRCLRGETDHDALKRVIELAGDRKQTRYVSGFVLPAAKAMVAVLSRDTAAVEAALASMLEHHTAEVKGEYRLDVLRGFMNAYGLFYVRIALERGIPLTIDSPYLPIWLVDLCRTTPPSAS